MKAALSMNYDNSLNLYSSHYTTGLVGIKQQSIFSSWKTTQRRNVIPVTCTALLIQFS